MNHNITFNFYSAYNDLYNVQINDNKIYVNMLCNNYVYECKEILKKFVNERGKILPRRVTGNCAKHQRHVASQVKIARQIALLPYAK